MPPGAAGGKTEGNTMAEKRVSQIHLIRHGVTEGNIKSWFYGSIDIPLTPDGMEHISNLVTLGIYPEADETETRAAADMYTSGMLRANQTYALIYGDRPHKELPLLREFRYGEFEGKSYDELISREDFRSWIEAKDMSPQAPGGDSSASFLERVSGGWEELLGYHRFKELSVRHSGKEAHSIVVCHGGVISAIMRLSFPEKKFDRFRIVPMPGRGYTLILENGRPVDYEKI